MKSFHLTVYAILTLFVCVMGVVATVAFMRSSNNTRVDPAQIKQMREIAKP